MALSMEKLRFGYRQRQILALKFIIVDKNLDWRQDYGRGSKMKANQRPDEGRPVQRAMGCSLAALCWPLAVGAQNLQTAAAQNAAASDIPEIIVTAQRRNENLQDVPIAVSAVSAAQLQMQGITSTLDIGRAVPSLIITQTFGYVLPRIRGVGNSVVGAGYESGVATYVDGVYLAAAPAGLLSLNNIEQIEVLKGPQGTLFGRNATGGLVSIITREPSSTPGGTVEVGYGDYQTATTNLYLTGGLGTAVAADFAGHVSTQGQGYGINRFNGRDVNRADSDTALRSSFLVAPGEDTKIQLSLDYEQNKGSIYGAVRLAPGTSTFFPQGPIQSAWDVDSDDQPASQYKGGGVTARIEQNLGFGKLTSISGYRESQNVIAVDADGTPTPALDLVEAQRDKQLSEEVNLTSNPSSLVKWVGGLYYFGAASSYDPSRAAFFGFLQPPTPFGSISALSNFGRERTESYAGYAQATAPVAHETNLTLGLRYSSEKHVLDAYQTIDIAAGPAGLETPFPEQNRRFSNPTWRVSLDHRFSPEVMVYASENRGFKSGGYNPQVPTDPAYEPEKLDAYEIGVKSDLLGRRLRVNAAAFYYDYSNLQVAKFTGSQTTYYNGAAARIYGLDTDFEARPTAHLTVSGGFTLVNDRFTNFPDAVFAFQVPGGVDTEIRSAAGNRLPQTADFTATLNADYHVPTSFGGSGLNLSYGYNSGYYSQPDNILRQPSYSTLAATLRFDLKNGMALSLWGCNLTNAKIAQTLAAGGFNSIVSYAPPLTYGAAISARF
jgi:iron complex outermembrane recepter protein